jgi:hypothetical protein
MRRVWSASVLLLVATASLAVCANAHNHGPVRTFCYPHIRAVRPPHRRQPETRCAATTTTSATAAIGDQYRQRGELGTPSTTTATATTTVASWAPRPRRHSDYDDQRHPAAIDDQRRQRGELGTSAPRPRGPAPPPPRPRGPAPPPPRHADQRHHRRHRELLADVGHHRRELGDHHHRLRRRDRRPASPPRPRLRDVIRVITPEVGPATARGGAPWVWRSDQTRGPSALRSPEDTERARSSLLAA